VTDAADVVFKCMNSGATSDALGHVALQLGLCDRTVDSDWLCE